MDLLFTIYIYIYMNEVCIRYTPNFVVSYSDYLDMQAGIFRIPNFRTKSLISDVGETCTCVLGYTCTGVVLLTTNNVLCYLESHLFQSN